MVMETVVIDSCVRGRHVYKATCKLHSMELQCRKEDDNQHNPYIVAVINCFFDEVINNFLFLRGQQEDDGLVILTSRERYLKRAIPRCASVHVDMWQSLPPSYYAYAYRMKIILYKIKLCIFSPKRKAHY